MARRRAVSGRAVPVLVLALVLALTGAGPAVSADPGVARADAAAPSRAVAAARGDDVAPSRTVAPPAAPARVGLLPGVPPAARRKERSLPRPSAWPFSERFPRTSGTGRYAAGALHWTDFLYDDNGAVSGPSAGESPGAYPFGTYEYPEENQAGNGADIFRAAIGVEDDATWWRVDWNSLVDRGVPAAAFGIDLDASGGPAVPWDGNVGVSSSGLDHTLVLTAAGAFLDGERVASTVVDDPARSFLAEIPREVLDPGGSSTVWLAAGLADAQGDAFLSLGPQHRQVPGQPNVYNLAFRDYQDEPADKNFWFEQNQAQTLTAPNADVSEFALEVDWKRLASRATEAEPFVRGWSNRWYVSSVELGQGVVPGLENSTDQEPNYLGRVQPYGVYVPAAYRKGQPARLTWLLHSLTINHNQYSATTPEFMRLACEARDSVCATTLGRGPDGYYRDEAELDFWEVWRTLDATYTLDANRTVIAGYSMGGFGAFNFVLDHPDLFAGMVILASAANEDLPRLENARWTPYYHAHGTQDQLVPYATEAVPTVEYMDRLGYRFRFDTFTNKDHVAWSLEDDFAFAAQWMGEKDRVRRRNPGHIIYRWFPDEVRPKLGIGPTGAWWLRGLVARDVTLSRSRARAVSHARPERIVEPQRGESPQVSSKGSPVVRRELTWKRAGRPAVRPRLTLRLRNVGAARVNLRRAGLTPLLQSRVRVYTDGPVTLTLRYLPPRSTLFLDGKRIARRAIRVPSGRHTVSIVRLAR